MPKFQIIIKFFFIFFILSLVNLKTLSAQNFDNQTNNLVVLFEKLKLSKDDILTKIIANQIDSIYEIILSDKNSFDNSLSDIKKYCSILISDDNKFRIITWNMFLTTGEYFYFGYVQYFSEENIFYYQKLTDNSNKIQKPLNEELSPENWYGCLYYQIITTKYKKEKYYTLLGWDGNNYLTNKKIIEVFRIKNDKIKIGHNFDFNGVKSKRIIFEYNKQSTMVLRWDKKMQKIVFDHLSPESTKYTGMYEFYGPDFSYDALQFKKGEWVLLEDVYVENPKQNN